MNAEIQNRQAREIDRRMALAREWDDRVGQVRGLKSFEDFLRPPPLDSLLAAAERGPVVIVNVSQWRCDALIITTGGVQVVRLPDLTTEEVIQRTASFLTVLQGSLPADPGLSFAAALEARARSLRCLLYTSDAADDLLCVDLGGRRIIKK